MEILGDLVGFMRAPAIRRDIAMAQLVREVAVLTLTEPERAGTALIEGILPFIAADQRDEARVEMLSNNLDDPLCRFELCGSLCKPPAIDATRVLFLGWLTYSAANGKYGQGELSHFIAAAASMQTASQPSKMFEEICAYVAERATPEHAENVKQDAIKALYSELIVQCDAFIVAQRQKLRAVDTRSMRVHDALQKMLAPQDDDSSEESPESSMLSEADARERISTAIHESGVDQAWADQIERLVVYDHQAAQDMSLLDGVREHHEYLTVEAICLLFTHNKVRLQEPQPA